MISVLIPVFNYDVGPLVATLHRQCLAANIPFEIICMDDASTMNFPGEYSDLNGVKIKHMKKNIGRASIRNHLANEANFPYLLFLDADVMPVYGNFIEKYVQAAESAPVIFGGRTYPKNKPNDPGLYLHWKYGTAREVKTAAERQSAPWHGFQTNNFLIQKELILRYPFNEQVRGYGHEDTLFGNELERAGVRILHLDNPAVHLGLETAGNFLYKTEHAVRNLVLLEQKGFNPETRLSLTGKRLIKIIPLYWLLYLLIPVLRANIMGRYPVLVALDIYKLFLYLKFHRSKINGI